jgi:abhydrolase domain-containing protein 12
VLAYDYRGFGRSEGSPTESGLIQDALAVTEWVMNIAKVPSKNILFLAQSLGTAIASATVNHYACKQPPTEFGGLILCAPFIDTSEVLLSYSLSGGIPILGPLKYLPWLRRYFTRRVTDTWKTKDRLQSILRKTTDLRLTLVHATSDKVIPYRMTDVLADMISDTLSEHGIDGEEKVDYGEGGTAIEWRSGRRIVRKVTLRHGGMRHRLRWCYAC